MKLFIWNLMWLFYLHLENLGEFKRIFITYRFINKDKENDSTINLPDLDNLVTNNGITHFKPLPYIISRRYYSTSSSNNLYPYDKWNEFHSTNKELFINIKDYTLTQFLNEFKEQILNNIKLNTNVHIMVKIRFNDNIIRSLNKVWILSNLQNNIDTEKSFNQLIKVILFQKNMKIDNYDIDVINEIFLEFKLTQSNTIETDHKNYQWNEVNYTSKEEILSNNINLKKYIDITKIPILNLPNTMNLTQWNPLIRFNDKCDYAHYQMDDIFYEFNIRYNFYICTISLLDDSNKILLKFKDYQNFENNIKLPFIFRGKYNSDVFDTSNLNSFYRSIYYNDKNNKQRIAKSYCYDKGIIKYSKNENNQHSYINPTHKIISRNRNNSILSNLSNLGKDNSNKRHYSTNTRLIKIIAADLETRKLNNNNLEVISAAYYDGTAPYTFYIKDYINSQDMLFTFINDLIQDKYHRYTIYFHNLGGFDGIFLLHPITKLLTHNNILTEIKIKPIIRNNKIIILNIVKTIYKDEKKSKKDKYTINIHFYDSYLLLPFSLSKLTKIFNVTQKREHDFKEHDTIDLNDNQFKDKLLKYNIQDCISLYEVLMKFNELFEQLFNLEIWEIPTLPSLAFKLFKDKFLKQDTIAVTWLEEYQDIKHAYYGGAVDVYRALGKNLKYYDINSLYPFVMANNKYPIGGCISFKGEKPLNDIFGIIHAKITTPNNLFVPFLPYKIHGNTLTPLGNWTGWYCSEELKYAESIGYQIEIIEGYHWEEKKSIFKDYVNKIYNLRLTFDKSDPRNTICKLLLNSLYGRFGMSPIQFDYKIFTYPEMTTMEYFNYTKDNHNILKFEGIDIEMIGKEIYNNRMNVKTYQKIMEINTPLSIFTTAYSRIHMHQFKLQYKDHLYYSDTDSLVLDTYLPAMDVGNNIGQFKLEYDNIEGVFLAPKVYGLLDNHNNEIIKMKGVIEQLEFNHLKSLLNKDVNHIELNQSKMYKHLDRAFINLKDTLFTLSITDNKRKVIYNKDNLFTLTEPYG